MNLVFLYLTHDLKKDENHLVAYKKRKSDRC